MAFEIVLDTNVVISGLRSRLGASFRVLDLLGDPRFRAHLSVPLLFEYEAVAKRSEARVPFSAAEIDDFLDSVCEVTRHQEIFFLWRPYLRDAGDDLVLEVAIAGGCNYIVTHNLRDFAGAEKFGVTAVTPQQFLRLMGESK
jgi:putative PIN family toxin of toxin-antitoxin system